MMKRFVPVLVERLQATRLQMLDVYGNASLNRAVGDARRRPDGAALRARQPRPARGRRHLDARDRDRRTASPSRPASSTCSTPSASARWRSAISGDPAEPERLVHTIRAVGKVSEALTRLKAGDPIGAARSLRPRLAGRGGGRPRRRRRRRRARPRAAAAGALPASRRARALRPGRPALRRAQPGRHPLPRASSRTGAGGSTSRSRSPSITPAATGAAMSAS